MAANVIARLYDANIDISVRALAQAFIEYQILNMAVQTIGDDAMGILGGFISSNLDFFRAPLIACICLNICSSILAILGNGVVIVSILTSQRLRTPSYLLITSISSVDFLIGLVHLPLNSAREVLRLLNTLYQAENAQLFVGIYLTAISFAMSLLISIDRYLALSLKHRYRIIVTKRRVLAGIMFFWLITFPNTWMALYLDGFRQIWPFVAFVLGVINISLIIVFYTMSFITFYRYRASQVNSQLNNQARHRFDFVKYKRSLHTMFFVLAFLLLCYFPYISSIFVLSNFYNNPDNAKIPILFNHFSLVLFGCNSIINPLIYVRRFHDIRLACIQTINKVLQICHCR